MKQIIFLALILISIGINAQNKSMNTITYHYKTPSELTDDELSQLVELIFSGGENTKGNILPKLKAAKEIAFAKKGNEIISTVSVKQPDEEIRKDIFERAKSSVSYKEIAFESGFWATKKEYQGKNIFKTMLQKQMQTYKDEKIYCILSNQSGLDLLTQKYGFKIVGSSFISRKSGKPYKLLIKE